MIKANTYLNAVPVAQELCATGAKLTVRPSTVLGQLLDASVSVETLQTTNPLLQPVRSGAQAPLYMESADSRASTVEYVTANREEASVHSMRIAAIVEDLAPFTTAHISQARTVVAPLVMELAGKMEKYLQDAKPTDPLTLFEIDQRKIPELALDEVFLNEGLASYKDVQGNWSYLGLRLKDELSDEYLQNLTNMSSERLNKLVAEWLISKPKDWLRAVWASNFGNWDEMPRDAEYTIVSEPGKGQNAYDALDTALAVYIMGKRMMLEVPSLEGNMSAMEFKSKMREIVDYAGGKAARSIAQIARQTSNAVVVSEVNPRLKKIVVHKDCYQAWLTAGGRPEALLGMLVSGNVIFAASALTEAQEKLLTQWNNYLMFSEATLRTEFISRFMDYLESEVLIGLAQLTDQEQEFARENPGFRDIVQKKVREQLEHHRHHLTDDVYGTALHLIAKARFYYTSAFQILREMAEVGKHNPDIDPREASLLSLLDYVADYLDAQIDVVK